MKTRMKEILFSLSVALFAVLLFAEGGEDLTATFRADRSAGRCSDATYLKSTVNTGSSAKNAFDGNSALVWISSVKTPGEYVGMTFPVDYHFGALPYVTAFNLSTPMSATNYKIVR